MKKISIVLLIITGFFTSKAQINSAKVYWVGHSLISHTYTYQTGAVNLIKLMDTMATSQNKTYDYHQHTIPGAPLGWSWSKNASSWASTEDLIQPLINTSHADYGSFDVIVLTEGIDITVTYFWWASSFYARKFYNAAKKANPKTRLFLYESWHHYNAADSDFRPEYGPMSTFNWKEYMLKVRSTWDSIADKASNPALTQTDNDYVYQGPGSDPGISTNILDIKTIPTGRVLVEVLDRLDSNLSGDNWSYKGSPLKDIDFFQNPLANYPADTITKVHPADNLDDIHPSNVLAYLNSLVHYAVIYKENPKDLPAANGVPKNIADIFKQVVWRVVTNDPRTGVEAKEVISVFENKTHSQNIRLYPNPATKSINIEFEDKVNNATIEVYNIVGEKVLSQSNISKKSIKLNTAKLKAGLYTVRILRSKDGLNTNLQFVKQ